MPDRATKRARADCTRRGTTELEAELLLSLLRTAHKIKNRLRIRLGPAPENGCGAERFYRVIS
ncbi:hypothetical protein [Nocardia sp. XZ_19_369]|uniref:hypothetical protein n=1 Tax=Nocardia sp. XZ_19_369 TaxID=2769487 RepID=UPI00188FDA2C|nr:hypothetical protein [Nocardia sp. XZ_19_369]